MKSPGNGFFTFSTASWLPRWPPRAGHLHAFSTTFVVVSPLSLFVSAAWWCRSGRCRAGNTVTLPAVSRCGGVMVKRRSTHHVLKRHLKFAESNERQRGVQDKWALCGAMYIGYLGLLRTGELLSLRVSQVTDYADTGCVVLSLPDSKGAKRKNVGEFVMFTDIHARMLLRRLVAGKAAADSVFGLSYTDLKQGLETTATESGHLPYLALYVAGPHYVLRPLGVCRDCAALHLTGDERSRVGQAATGGPRPRRAVSTNLPGAAQSAGVARKDHHYSVVSTKW